MLNANMMEHLLKRASMKDRIAPLEWQARVELAACYRLCVHYGMTDLIYNHISLRIPGSHDEFLINAFGLLYEEVTASNLVKVDIDGNSLDDVPLDINPAGFVIHSAIHKARSDASCVFHTHTRAGVAVSAQARGLLPISQHALRFYNRIGYHAFEGIALDLAERERLVKDIGSHNVLILQNHGLLTCGKSVKEAFELMYYLDMACKIQLDASAAGSELMLPPAEVCEKTARQFENASFVGDLDWQALRRFLDRRQSDYQS